MKTNITLLILLLITLALLNTPYAYFDVCFSRDGLVCYPAKIPSMFINFYYRECVSQQLAPVCHPFEWPTLYELTHFWGVARG